MLESPPGLPGISFSLQGLKFPVATKDFIVLVPERLSLASRDAKV